MGRIAGRVCRCRAPVGIPFSGRWMVCRGAGRVQGALRASLRDRPSADPGHVRHPDSWKSRQRTEEKWGQGRQESRYGWETPAAAGISGDAGTSSAPSRADTRRPRRAAAARGPGGPCSPARHVGLSGRDRLPDAVQWLSTAYLHTAHDSKDHCARV